QRSRRKLARDDAVGDSDRYLLPRVACMKMWWIVLVVVDHDHDSEKTTDRRHCADSSGNCDDVNQMLGRICGVDGSSAARTLATSMRRRSSTAPPAQRFGVNFPARSQTDAGNRLSGDLRGTRTQTVTSAMTRPPEMWHEEDRGGSSLCLRSEPRSDSRTHPNTL